MAKKEMKTLTIGGNTYEIVDESARNDIENLKEIDTNMQTEIAVERARISSFVALTEGSTTGDAELMDARIDANGVTHATVGEAIRAQHNEQKAVSKYLSDELQKVYIDNNLFDPSLIIDGTFYADGRFYTGSNYTGYQCTDYIPVEPNTEYIINFEIGRSYLMTGNIFGIDANKGCIGKCTYDASKYSFVTQENCSYVIINFTVGKESYDDVTLIKKGEISEPYINVSLIRNDSIDEEKLSTPVKEKLNKEITIDVLHTKVLDIFTDKTVVASTNINHLNGVEQSPNNQFCATVFIKVKPETSYRVSRDNSKYQTVGNIAFYDKDKIYISGTQSVYENFTTPQDCEYIRFSIYIEPYTMETFTFDNMTIVEGTELKPPTNINILPYNKFSTLFGKKWVCIGDSITEVNSVCDWHYHDYISVENNMSVVNMGVGGSGYIHRANVNKAFYQLAENIPTDADLVTIFGGVNDVLLSTKEMGEPTDDSTETWCGCVNKVIDVVRSKYIYIPLGIISPLPTAWTDQLEESNYDIQRPDDETCRMSVFVSKLKRICELKGVPFLDLFHSSNLQPWNEDMRMEYYSSRARVNGDGLHPNSKGHKLFYRRIEQFIEGII